MNWIIWTVVGLYVVGFLFFFWVNINIGPVTLVLALFRAAVWPVWLATGWPSGEVQPMD